MSSRLSVDESYVMEKYQNAKNVACQATFLLSETFIIEISNVGGREHDQ